MRINPSPFGDHLLTGAAGNRGHKFQFGKIPPISGVHQKIAVKIEQHQFLWVTPVFDETSIGMKDFAMKDQNSKPRAIIVEDEALVAEELSDRLTSLGFSVVGVVDSAEDAVASTLDQRPDLVLMDIRLKGKKDGIQAADEIRRLVKVPIIFLTAYSDRVTLDRAKNAEPYGYVLKPFHERELQVTIELAMHRFAVEQTRLYQ